MNTKKNLNERKRVIIIGAGILALFIIYGIYLISGLPSLEQLENPKPELATKIFSIDGEVLDQFYIKNRTRISFRELPPNLINALVATEDKNFYDHWGVDLPRFFRAMVKNVLTLHLREGASTITQQLARNLYDLKVANESVFGKMSRKIREFITAVQIERNYTKEEILEMYFSISYFGRSAYGISSASQIYFGKTPVELTLGEGALLVGMLKGPGAYDPIRHMQRAINRRNTVLDQMVKYGFIEKNQEDSAENEQMEFEADNEHVGTGVAPHFVEWIRQQLLQKADTYGFDIYRDGLSVYTTLDSRMQRYANQAVEEHLATYQDNFRKQWNWKSHREELDQSIANAIRTSDAYRDADSRKERDSIARALRSKPAFIDSIENIATRIEVGFVAIDHADGNIVAMV
ncbi:MAG TPA: transglycosylase domain-containing protein, partial [Bacteroidota bacterium]|nr:transglycosylase domain-containing protein [Bacteroidota bacterium]